MLKKKQFLLGEFDGTPGRLAFPLDICRAPAVEEDVATTSALQYPCVPLRTVREWFLSGHKHAQRELQNAVLEFALGVLVFSGDADSAEASCSAESLASVLPLLREGLDEVGIRVLKLPARYCREDCLQVLQQAIGASFAAANVSEGALRDFICELRL